ncbi:hypothetical protein SNOG_03418 [Parastagonospora nodorum SN15]|uniref:Uncharacterized protein n=1 Tax=Phaeosphaeria nodorum (strain SN15 / ATCC MYA-4574 / FGSC 10173) TaxID=321614 RepID=Q0UXU6_PHANO|nr:hypothetical protein SNOG_03418 [Parastagonospora nodorum SN15]EAT88623.1 hypothetical protein SNOG_03418 [Parastagonospora nodorum SN15]
MYEEGIIILAVEAVVPTAEGSSPPIIISCPLAFSYSAARPALSSSQLEFFSPLDLQVHTKVTELEVTCWQRQSVFAVLQPVENHVTQTRALAAQREIIAEPEEGAAVGEGRMMKLAIV